MDFNMLMLWCFDANINLEIRQDFASFNSKYFVIFRHLLNGRSIEIRGHDLDDLFYNIEQSLPRIYNDLSMPDIGEKWDQSQVLFPHHRITKRIGEYS